MQFRQLRLQKMLTATVLGLSMLTSYAEPPLNLSVAKHAVTQYYDSGAYEKDVQLAINHAREYLQHRIRENSTLDPQNKHQLAIVFDIDDTCITNYPDYRQHDFAHTPAIINAAFKAAKAPVIQPVLRFYNEALKQNLALFFVTLRPEVFTPETITNLHNAGFFAWQGLFLPHGDEIKLSPEVYKTAIRKQLTAQGYDIVLTIGDQPTDLIGGYAEKGIKLPNPIYSLVDEKK